jgi:Holliday junction DNA helicase RuvA
MIASLEGAVSATSAEGAVINVGGVGFFVHAPVSTVNSLSGRQSVKLHTKMIVREDDISLVGFLTRDELSLFNLLTGVTGVGVKAALSLLGAMEPSRLTMAILTEDTAALSKAPGIGKKTAMRLAMELKDKIAGKAAPEAAAASPQQTLAMAGSARQDAADALTALGYPRADAVRTVMETAADGMDASAIVKLSLKKLTSL